MAECFTSPMPVRESLACGPYTLLIDRIGALIRGPRVRARVEQVTGFLLIGFALRLVSQQS